jgi:hypothetical protein
MEQLSLLELELDQVTARREGSINKSDMKVGLSSICIGIGDEYGAV